MPRVNQTAWIERHAGTTPVMAPGRKGLRWIASRLARIQHPDVESETFYSLAQHSVVVARILESDPRLALYGLMHNAPAAWLGGITREAQFEVARLSYGEEPLAFLIGACDRVALPDVGLTEAPSVDALQKVERALHVAFNTARRDLVPGAALLPDDDTFNQPINPLAWHRAEELFLGEAERLCLLSGNTLSAAA